MAELGSISLAPSRQTHYLRPTVDIRWESVEAVELPRDGRALTTEMSHDLLPTTGDTRTFLG